MQELFEKINNLYNIPNIISGEKIEKGFLSENYKLSTSTRAFFLKKYRFNNEDRIKSIHSVKKYFNDGGISVIMPIEMKSGSTYFEHDGAYFTLFPFATGLQPERGGLNDNMIISMGKVLGKIHLLSKDGTLKISKTFSDWNKGRALETADILLNKINQIENKTDFDELALKTILFKKSLIEDNNIKYEDLELTSDHLIHGDYLDQNVFFNDNSEVKYVFDFEKTRYEPRTQEIFRSATYSFLNTDFNETSIENMKLYIKSYREVYPIEKEEMKNGLIAHYIKSMHGFWVEKEHYLKNNDRVDVFLGLNYKRLEFTSENINILIQELC